MKRMGYSEHTMLKFVTENKIGISMEHLAIAFCLYTDPRICLPARGPHGNVSYIIRDAYQKGLTEKIKNYNERGLKDIWYELSILSSVYNTIIYCDFNVSQLFFVLHTHLVLV